MTFIADQPSGCIDQPTNSLRVNIVPGATSATPLSRALVNISNSGDTVVVANPGPTICKIYKLFLSASGAVNFLVKDGVTQIDGPYILTAFGSSFVLQNDGDPHWITTGDFVLNLSTAVNLTGQVYYTLA